MFLNSRWRSQRVARSCRNCQSGGGERGNVCYITEERGVDLRYRLLHGKNIKEVLILLYAIFEQPLYNKTTVFMVRKSCFAFASLATALTFYKLIGIQIRVTSAFVRCKTFFVSQRHTTKLALYKWTFKVACIFVK